MASARARRMGAMRVALVSPYSWTYPGGVTRHIEALAAELRRRGPRGPRAFAPFDREGRAAALRHRGAPPQVREAPDWLVPLGGTIGWPLNGAVSNLARTRPPRSPTLRRELRAFAPDVVHLHEPVAPVIGWDALTSTDAPLVGTFHCYSESVPPHLVAALLGARRKLNQLDAAARGLRGRRLDGPALLRRPLPGRPQRRGAAGRRRAGPASPRRGRAAADRVRRPGGRAQGPARAPARVRGAALPRARRADDRGRDHRGDRPARAGRRRHHGARAGRRRRPPRRARRLRTCCARRRSAASRSAWCSPRHSRPAARSSPPTSPAIATW